MTDHLQRFLPNQLSRRAMLRWVLLLLMAGIAIGFYAQVQQPPPFRFEGHINHDEMMQTMRDLLPEGTPKEVVETILVEGAGATVQKVPRDFEAYSYKGKVMWLEELTWNIVVKYYDDHTVDQVWVNGSAVHQYKPFKHGKIQ